MHTPLLVEGSHGPLAALVADPHAGVDRRGGVLLVPGFTGSKEDFTAVLDPIAAAGYAVVALDQRGQHESPHAGERAHYDISSLAEDLVAVAAGLSPEPVHLVGHSFGGLVARAAVISHPGAWRSLVLLGSGPGAIPSPRAEVVRELLVAIPTLGLSAIWAIKADREAAAGLAAPPPEVEALMSARWHGNDPAGLERMGAQLLVAPDRVDELSAAGRPVLVAFGEGDDAWSPAVQAEMAARLGAPVVRIGAAGHSPAAEAPAATVDAVLAWWRRCEEAEGAGS